MSQIQQAVDIANSSSASGELKKQALDFLHQLKSSGEAVNVFSQYLHDSSASDVGRFFALQVLSEQAQAASAGANQETLFALRQTGLEFLRKQLEAGDGEGNSSINSSNNNNNSSNNNSINNNSINGSKNGTNSSNSTAAAGQKAAAPEFIRNKVAELFAHLFYNMYGEVNNNLWSTFFGDLVQLTGIAPLRECKSADGGVSFNALGLDYFLRICASINTEIGDQAFVRSKEMQAKNNDLKDYMRIQDVECLTNIWFGALLSCQKFPVLASLVLQCVGSYISWIDINLIVQPQYITTIYEYLQFPHTKLACGQCLCEIISKKMKPADKLQLLSMLNLTDRVLATENDDDLELYEQMAKLTNCVALEFSMIIDQCTDSQELQSVSSAADEQIINVMAPLLLKFMAHQYDSVTQQCFPFVTHYLAVMKKLFSVGGKPGSAVAVNSKRIPIDPAHLNFLKSLETVCIMKMKIDESCDVTDDSEEIDEFVGNIRSKLKVFQDTIAVINPEVYFEIISMNIEQSITEQQDWRVLELAIYQLHNFAESIRNNLFGVNKTDIATSKPAQVMEKYMNTLLNHPTLFQMNNPLIQISFFELIVRHNNFTQIDNKDLTLLNIFCTPFSMFSGNERVRLRTWYLFTRLIKTSKPKLTTEVLSLLLSKISPLLSIKVSPVAEELDTTFDSQLYLFEGVGVLIGANSSAEYDILDAVLTPLFSDLEQCISAQVKSPQVVLQTHHILMAIGTLARGLHSGLVPDNQVNNAKVSEKVIVKSLIEKFSNIAEVILVTFSYFNKFEAIRDAARFSFARLIPILNNQIIPFASRLISIFLNSDLKTLEMSDFLGFLGQMVHMFKDDDNCYQLFNNLFTPVVSKVFTLETQLEQESSTPPETKPSNGKSVIVTDSFRDKINLKKAYYSFLMAMVSNHCTSLLLTESNKNILPNVLNDLLTYTPEEIHETSTMRLCLNVLVNFVKFFGTGVCKDEQDRNAINISKLDGLNEFFITKCIPLLFEIPFKPEYAFNIQDGGGRVIACDLSQLLKTLYMVNYNRDAPNDNPCIRYLTEVYFPQIQFPQALITEFIDVLEDLDYKNFEKYFVQFISNMKH